MAGNAQPVNCPGLALLRAARAFAFVSGRDHVLPDDVQTVFVPVAAHRLWLRDAREEHSERAVLALLKSLPVPM